MWHANLAGRRDLRRGIPAAEAGLPRYSVHANDIDFQIESDFVGLMAPGLYQPANDVAMRAGRIMNCGDGIHGGVFVSCMYAAAFVERDPRRIVERGLACIPSRSPCALPISDLLGWSKQQPDDWKKAWRLAVDKFEGTGAIVSGPYIPDGGKCQFTWTASPTAGWTSTRTARNSRSASRYGTSSG